MEPNQNNNNKNLPAGRSQSGSKPRAVRLSAKRHPGETGGNPTAQSNGGNPTAQSNGGNPPANPPARAAGLDNSQTRIQQKTSDNRIPGGDAHPGTSGNAGGRPRNTRERRYSEGVSTLLSVVKAITYIAVLIVISGILSYNIIFIGNDVFAFVKSNELIDITIPEYATIDDISRILSESELIKYKGIFKIYSKLKDDDGLFVAGDYTVTPAMNYDELLAAFKDKKIRQVVRVQIPEGYTSLEIIELFLSYGIGTREGFETAINEGEYDYDFVRALEGNTKPGRIYRLEGYLFPDTYDFYTDSSEYAVINKLLANFNRKFAPVFYEQADAMGLSVDEIVTLASMIEKETKYVHEFETVSSVFHNRMKNKSVFPRMQSDATVIYAMHMAAGERPAELSGSDLSYASPYNTYLHDGLPPGPIANPGYLALTCALSPANSGYYYFVSNKSGETTFSRTEAEHLAAIRAAREE